MRDSPDLHDLRPRFMDNALDFELFSLPDRNRYMFAFRCGLRLYMPFRKLTTNECVVALVLLLKKNGLVKKLGGGALDTAHRMRFMVNKSIREEKRDAIEASLLARLE